MNTLLRKMTADRIASREPQPRAASAETDRPRTIALRPARRCDMDLVGLNILLREIEVDCGVIQAAAGKAAAPAGQIPVWSVAFGDRVRLEQGWA